MKRGRPKGRSRDNRSFGPLGDLIRKYRLSKGLGLLDVARACECSVQFVSNIEHGRAPLPWEKVDLLANALRIPVEEIQVANLAIRSDFKSFFNTSKPARNQKSLSLSKVAGSASAVAIAAHDGQLQEIIQRYQTASPASRKKFVRAALDLLEH